MTLPRPALGTLSPNKQNAFPLNQFNILDKDNTINGLPIHIPLSRIGSRRTRGVGELSSATVAAMKKTLPTPKKRISLRIERKDKKEGDGIVIWQDSNGSKAAEEESETAVKIDPPPPTPPPPPRATKVKFTSPLQQETPPRLRQKTLQSPPPQHPSALTNLLLSHVTVELPTISNEIPTPPRSRARANEAITAAHSLDLPIAPTVLAETTDPSPLKLLRLLRQRLAEAAPTPEPEPEQQQPGSAPTSPIYNRVPSTARDTKNTKNTASSSSSTTTSTRPATTSSSKSPAIPTKFSPHSFNLTSLPSLTHHSAHSVISLHPTYVTLLLREPSVGGSNTLYTLRPYGGPVTVFDRRTNLSTSYALEDLPWKHLAAYRYTRRFVAAVAKRTVVSYGGVEGASGRVWADGRGMVEVAITTEDSEADDGTGKRRVGVLEIELRAPGEVVGSVGTQEQRKLAKRVYKWLVTHPAPPAHEAEGDDTTETVWEVDEATAFVRGVGWCRDRGDGRWSMKFLDGVKMEVRADGSVIWKDADGGRKTLRRGMEDTGVRARVGAFVEAGL